MAVFGATVQGIQEGREVVKEDEKFSQHKGILTWTIFSLATPMTYCEITGSCKTLSWELNLSYVFRWETDSCGSKVN